MSLKKTNEILEVEICSEKYEHLVSSEVMKHWRSVMNDDVGRPRIVSLFWETRLIENECKFPPLFTTKVRPHTVPTPDKKGLITYPSLKEIYFTYNHVPFFEYEFATDIFGSWEHWTRLCASSSLKDMFAKWREELTIKIKCSAMQKVIKASLDTSSVGFNASKYLADEGYVAAKRGRVAKEEKERQARIAAGVNDNLKDDMERLGLEVVNGGK